MPSFLAVYANYTDDACDKILPQLAKMIDHANRWVIKPPEAPHVVIQTIPEQKEEPPHRENANTPPRRSVSPGGASRA